MPVYLSLPRTILLLRSRIQHLVPNPLTSLPITQHFSSSPLPLDHHHYYVDDTFDPESFFTSLLATSTRKSQLTQIQARLVVSGLQDNGFIVAKLIHVCADIGEICYAREVFDEFPDPYVHLWNAIIRGYSRHDLFGEAIEMYLRMRVWGVSPDCFTLPHVLKACGGIPRLEVGRAVHGQIFRHGFESDVFVQNGLVALYAKCGRIERARIVFDRLCNRTIVSWTSIISGYAQNGQPLEALMIFSEMSKLNLKPDWIALVSVLRAYTDVEDLEQGKAVHGSVIKMGLEYEPDLRIGLTAMYAKCGQVMVAKALFDQMEVYNVILWNAMISGFAKNGCADEAVELFRDMICKNIRPDSITANRIHELNLREE
ncbi:mitochondrial editing factor 22 [Actinidia rufa]|uniref:Mitochondrial editing factor 22 n=1 Tax=Actinidia rufa TaxID=165716 RepID=A0A7J0H3T8_9ERIC|nr:mitochondrial editing factor 22 [Actinidia rufa]